MGLIEKEKFVELMESLADRSGKWSTFIGAMEELSPGEYVNFWPELPYEDAIRELLNIMFGFGEEWSPISQFMVEGRFGAEQAALVGYTLDDVEYDITNAAALYDSCLSVMAYLELDAAKTQTQEVADANEEN